MKKNESYSQQSKQQATDGINKKETLTSSTESSTSRCRLSTNSVVKLFACTIANSPV